MCEWDAAPLPGQGRRMALCKGGDPPSAWRRSRSVRTPPPREGSCSRQRRASSAPCCPRGNTARARAKLCRRRAKISPFPLHLRKRRLFQNMQAPEGAPAAPLSLRKRRSLRSATDRVAVLRPLSLRKRRSLRSETDRVAVLRPLSLRKRRLLRSATDSGSRFFVRFPCGSSVCCAARRTAGYGSSSVLPAKAAFTARPAPAPRRRPPRWRAWPEGSCPSAHPASSRASPRPSR